jgi:antitoxin component YwqK of YwqJK toxin-antitoxin module
MRKIRILIIIALCITSCTNKIATSEIEKRGGGQIFYKGEPYTGKVFELYDNGLQKLNYDVTNGLIDGVYEEYFENTKLKIKKQLKNGKNEGDFEEYIENGELKEKGTYKNSILVGKYFIRKEGLYGFFYNNFEIKEDGTVSKFESHLNSNSGTLLQKFSLINNEIGLNEKYYKSGKILAKYKIRAFKFKDKTYAENNKVGLFIDYHENGQIADKGNYSFRGYIGQKVGEWVSYYENGQLKQRIIYNNNGNQNGTTTSYYENGHIMSIETYKKGQIVSEDRKWYNDSIR